jgi:hypothetical protein
LEPAAIIIVASFGSSTGNNAAFSSTHERNRRRKIQQPFYFHTTIFYDTSTRDIVEKIAARIAERARSLRMKRPDYLRIILQKPIAQI